MKALPTSLNITIADKEITLHKLPLKKVVTLLEALGKLPQEFSQLDTQDNSKIVENLALLVALSLPKFAQVLAQAIDREDITSEWLLDNCSLDDAIALVVAVCEVNNLAGIIERIKKLQALAKPRA